MSETAIFQTLVDQFKNVVNDPNGGPLDAARAHQALATVAAAVGGGPRDWPKAFELIGSEYEHVFEKLRPHWCLETSKRLFAVNELEPQCDEIFVPAVWDFMHAVKLNRYGQITEMNGDKAFRAMTEIMDLVEGTEDSLWNEACKVIGSRYNEAFGLLESRLTRRIIVPQALEANELPVFGARNPL